MNNGKKAWKAGILCRMEIPVNWIVYDCVKIVIEFKMFIQRSIPLKETIEVKVHLGLCRAQQHKDSRLH